MADKGYRANETPRRKRWKLHLPPGTMQPINNSRQRSMWALRWSPENHARFNELPGDITYVPLRVDRAGPSFH